MATVPSILAGARPRFQVVEEARAIQPALLYKDRRPQHTAGLIMALRARPSVYKIVEGIAERYDLLVSELVGDGRTARVTKARRLLYRALRMRGFSLTEIGSMLDRDHTSVLHGLRPKGSRKQGLRPSSLASELAKGDE